MPTTATTIDAAATTNGGAASGPFAVRGGGAVSGAWTDAVLVGVRGYDSGAICGGYVSV